MRGERRGNERMISPFLICRQGKEATFENVEFVLDKETFPVLRDQGVCDITVRGTVLSYL